MPVIAVDAMGGDFAPDEVVKGVARASLNTAIECLLVGDERRIQAILDSVSYNPEHISIQHAGEVIGMNEPPKEALRAKREASIVVGARLVAEGRADALVSAGNTGACILACARHFRPIKGVRKTALASVYPRQTEYPGQDQLALILDVGATIRCDALELVQFAVMGSAYASRISKVARPRIGLLNMGAEEFKGGEVLTDAYRRLKALPVIDFVGNIEGDDVAKGRADVIVCEGLLGNVVLKLIEGVAEVVTDVASNAVRRRLLWRLGMLLLSRGIREVANLADYTKYGGAPLLGFESIFIKAHGRSTAQAIENAVKVAAKAVRDGVPQEIAAGDPGGTVSGWSSVLARWPTGNGGWRRLWPRSHTADRRPPPTTVIYRWDLDKTYLKSDFESLRKMMRVPFERAEDKVDEPGVVALIRALKANARAEGHTAFVYFISASPPQIGRAIREKLALDGIEVDGIVFKDQIQHLVRGRFRFLREQVGFKLAELLKARIAAPPDAVEFLFGDDWESDPVIYSLYADVAAGRLDHDALGDILVRLRIDPARLVEIKALSQRVPRSDAVRRIFINLERRTPPGRFHPFGARLVPTFNYFQTALVLHDEGVAPIGAVIEVARSLLDRSAYTRERLRNSLDDLCRRGYLAASAGAEMRRELEEAGVLPGPLALGSLPRRMWRRLRRRRGGARVPAASVPVARVDYARLIDAWLAPSNRPGAEAT